jgi:hypothetical protein
LKSRSLFAFVEIRLPMYFLMISAIGSRTPLRGVATIQRGLT